jgi:hypothetical protein
MKWILYAFGVYFIGIALFVIVGAIIERVAKSCRRCPHGLRLATANDCCVECKRSHLEKLRTIARQDRKRTLTLSAEQLKQDETERLSRCLLPDLDELRRLSPPRFEDEVARMFQRLGYAVQQTPYSNDQGRDAILHKNGEKYLVECKRYQGTVGRPEIQKFHSAIIFENAKRGFFVTTGDFTPGGAQYAKDLPIELINGTRLLHYIFDSKKDAHNDDSYRSMCTECGATVQHSLREPQARGCLNGHAVSPTLTVMSVLGGVGTPSCPKCGSRMRRKKSKRTNREFWGCSRYPRCKSVLSIGQITTGQSRPHLVDHIETPPTASS